MSDSFARHGINRSKDAGIVNDIHLRDFADAAAFDLVNETADIVTMDERRMFAHPANGGPNRLVDIGELHTAIRMMHQNDLARLEQLLRQGKRPQHVVGNDTARITEDVRFARPESKDRKRVDARVHAGNDCDMPRRDDRARSLKAAFVREGVGEKLIGLCGHASRAFAKSVRNPRGPHTASENARLMATKRLKILLVQGPNMSYLGKRQPELYGTTTAAELDAMLHEHAKADGTSLDIFYTHIEGEAIGRIYQGLEDGIDGLLMNPAAFIFAGYALRDCLRAISVPYVEVHMTNIDARGIKSLTAEAARGVIAGFGTNSYLLGLDALIAILRS